MLPDDKEVRPVADDRADHEQLDGDRTSSQAAVYGRLDSVATEAEARRITDRIRLLLDSVAGQLDKLAVLVQEPTGVLVTRQRGVNDGHTHRTTQGSSAKAGWSA